MNDKSNFSFFELVVFLLSIYVIVVMIIQMIIPFPKDIEELLWMIDTSICVLFFIDFLVNIYKAENKKQYFIRYGILDLLASIPNIGILRLGKIAKITRVFRIIKAATSINSILSNTFKNKGEGIFKSVILFSILLIITSSMLILIFEQDNPQLNTAQNSFWWTIYTLIGMDYCDPPHSLLGKILATCLCVTGMSLLGSFTAYLAGLFLNNKK